MEQFIDSHSHVGEDPRLENIATIIKEAKAVNVNKIALVSDNLTTAKRVIELKKTHEDVFFAVVGIHPYEVGKQSFEQFEQFVYENIDVINAIGEIGLDYHYEISEDEKEKQRQYFIKQIRLANNMNLSINVHTRDAIEETYNILKENDKNHKGIIHCFSGSFEMAIKFIKLGYKLGIGGVITFKNSKLIKEVVKVVELNNIVLETDSPYLAPEPYRGTTNYPKYIIEIATYISALKATTIEKVAEITFKNTMELYGKN